MTLIARAVSRGVTLIARAVPRGVTLIARRFARRDLDRAPFRAA
ncbi:hypothetical protein [Dactylosporangium sp. NPDC049140]